ncbi:hypothetical protein ACFX16_034266 [Malus domestica]
MKPTWIFTVATVNPTILEMTLSPNKHNPLKSWRRSPKSKDYLNCMVKIDTTLSPPIWLALISFLQENTEVFAWSYEDMPSIFLDIICHRLSIDPKTKSVR